MKKGCIITFYILAVSLLLLVVQASGKERADKNIIIVAGYSFKLFYDVDINDARAASKVWLEIIAKRTSEKVDKAETLIFHDSQSIIDATKSKSVDIVTLLPNEYIDLRTKIPVDPIFVADFGKTFYQHFILLTRTDTGINQLGDLKQKKLIIEGAIQDTPPSMWLDIILMKAGFKEAKDFLGSFKGAQKPSQTILPVFFRQADACIVNSNSFNTMVELNPQLGKELKIIAVSPEFISAIVALRKDFEFKGYIHEALDSLHKDPQGKQLLMLFRVSKLVPFLPVYLETVEELLKEHRNLKSKTIRQLRKK